MDSGNTSGSLQSSSGGDDEFDSRSDHQIQIPSLLSNNPSAATTTTTTTTPHFLNQNQNQNLLSLHHNASTVLFDPSTSYLQSLSSHPNPLLNMDFLRSSSSRQRPATSSDLGHLTSTMFGAQHQPDFNMPCPVPPMNQQQPRSSNQNQSTTSTLGVRNSKKRTRASRRAPTTVLTTDTSNFRAMVQEFTGIPAPPFSGGPYSRLFGSSGLRSGHLDPIYPLRPKILHPFHDSSSSTPPNNNSLLLDNMHNPLLSFQSLLQPHQHQLQLHDHHHQMGLTTTTTTTTHQQQHHHDHQGSWRSSSGVGSSSSHLRPPSNSNVDHQPGNYNNNSHQERSNIDATIFSYTPAPHTSSDFDHHQNTNPPAAQRGDGTVDSWICPSD